MAELETDTESTILTRLIAPKTGNLGSEAAKALLGLSFPDSDIARMNELAAKNRVGSLSASEREEMESYSRVGNLLNLLQSKARRSFLNG